MALTPRTSATSGSRQPSAKGYEMDEVDAFLDQIEIENGTLQRERRAQGPPGRRRAGRPPPSPPRPRWPRRSPRRAGRRAGRPNAQAVAMLALAQKTADEHTARARAGPTRSSPGPAPRPPSSSRPARTRRCSSAASRPARLRAQYRQRLRQYHESALARTDAKERRRAGLAAGGAPSAALRVPLVPQAVRRSGLGSGVPGVRPHPALAPPPAASLPAAPAASVPAAPPACSARSRRRRRRSGCSARRPPPARRSRSPVAPPPAAHQQPQSPFAVPRDDALPSQT